LGTGNKNNQGEKNEHNDSRLNHFDLLK
jgi:hypothetical protein